MLDEMNAQAVIIEEKPEAGLMIVNGNTCWIDSKGGYMPEELVKPEFKLEDQAVRKMIGHARNLSAQIARFRGHTFEDIGAFMALIEEKYDAKRGGKKGNLTLLSYDGLLKVQVQVADIIDFGAQLQTAKSLIDECLNEWASNSRAEIRAVVTNAFNTDKEGLVNRSELFKLLRLNIEDERWQRAMDAVRDAIRVVGSREYVRFYERDHRDGDWRAITIDLAKAS